MLVAWLITNTRLVAATAQPMHPSIEPSFVDQPGFSLTYLAHSEIPMLSEEHLTCIARVIPRLKLSTSIIIQTFDPRLRYLGLFNSF